MAPRFTDSLLTTDAGMVRIHRRVVRVGAAAAWLVAALFLLIGFLGRSEGMFIEAIGPALAAGFMTLQIVLGRENGGLAMFAAAIVTLLMYTAVGNQATLIPAAVSLVVIGSIGMLLTETHQSITAVGVALLLFVTPFLWGLRSGETLQLGIVMSLAFVMTSAVFFTIRNAASSLNIRFQMLFENSPTAVMEEDWSEALAYIRTEYTGRPERIRPFLMAYPAVVSRAVSMARIVRVNRAAVDLLEADGPAELLGYREGAKVTEETIEAFVGALVALYEGRSAYEQEVLALTMKDRPIWLQTRCVDTSPGSNASTILVGLADITHVRARQQAMAELVRAKDEFIAKVSHELRTPLTAVVGLTSELSSAPSLSDSERIEWMSLVAGQAAEMACIVEDLLVASRAEMGTIAIDSTEVDLERELQTAIEGLGIVIDEAPNTIPAVIADASRVRQILRNLLTNAERYGGPNRRILAGELFDRVWLEVRDDGKGVPGDRAAEIFEPYVTAHRGVKGSVGLGLSVARQLAQLMNGSLTYHRDANETVFRLELPAAESREPALTSNINAG